MFEAWLLVCSLANPADCVELKDNRGPYPTQQECRARVDEMVIAILPTFVIPIDVKWRCPRIPGQKIHELVTPNKQKARPF